MTPEVRHVEVRLDEVRAAEVHAAEVRHVEVRAAEVNLDGVMFFPPLIPCLRAFPQGLQMFFVSHTPLRDSILRGL